jgi:hypothetical protein
VSIYTPAPSTTDGFQKFRVHRREFHSYEFFEHFAASVRSAGQFPFEFFGKTFFADFSHIKASP